MMRRFLSPLLMTISFLMITLTLARSQTPVQAQPDIRADNSLTYLPFTSTPALPEVTLSNITLDPKSPVTIPSNKDQHIDVKVTVETNYRGALVVTLFRNDVVRDGDCVMVNPPGPTRVSLSLDVSLKGNPGTKDFIIDIRFRPGAANCTSNSYFPDVVTTRPYRIIWESVCPTSPFTQLLRNGSFEEGWTDLTVSIQKANYWDISWIQPGQAIYDDAELANSTPEFNHKLASQLPEIERPCQPEALILDGQTTYKIFWHGKWGGELRQTVGGLTPGQQVKLTAPIWLDTVEDYGYEAAARVDIGSASTGWVWDFQVSQRKWTYHILKTTVPSSGQVTVVIRLKSRFYGADFFIDGIRLEPQS
jgi:hypothetical protein